MRDDLSVSWDRAECLMQNYMRGCKNCQRGYTLIFGGNLIIDPIGRQVSRASAYKKRTTVQRTKTV